MSKNYNIKYTFQAIMNKEGIYAVSTAIIIKKILGYLLSSANILT